MDIQTYRARVSLPIPGDAPQGIRLLEDPLLDFVEAQMMKVGSLAHGEVQWIETEHAALTLLETKSKDLKILAHLLQCLQYQASPERFTLSIYVLADFISSFWETCFPAPGPRGVLPRRKFFSQIIQRTVKCAEKIDGGMLDIEQKSEVDTALAALEIAAKDEALSVDLVEDVRGILRRKICSTAVVAPVESSHKYSVYSPSSAASASADLVIDGSSDRAVRQSLLKVAEFLGELEEGQVLSLRLRRFAIWHAIGSAPNVDANGETPLMPVSIDRVSEYQDELKRDLGLVLWRKVEQSLTVAPYWFDGHLLSYQIAEKLGNHRCAEAILDEARAFVQRLPALLDMHFKGGTPFVGEQTRLWLQEGGGNKTAETVATCWDEKRKEAYSLAEEAGLSVALAMLNDGLAGAREPRDQFYWRLLSADVMHRHQLPAIAKQQYQTLLEQTRVTALTDWEPSLVQRLEQVQ